MGRKDYFIVSNKLEKYKKNTYRSVANNFRPSNNVGTTVESKYDLGVLPPSVCLFPAVLIFESLESLFLELY